MSFIIKESSRGYDAINVSDELMNSSRTLFISSEINASLADEIIKNLMYLDSISNDEIKIYINSPGGSVSDGLAIFDTISLLDSPITTICTGLAASMGAIIFLSGQKRKMLPHSKLMIHDASFSNADFSHLKPDEIQEHTNSLLKTTSVLRGIIATKTGQDIKKVTSIMRKDSYFTSKEAIAFGLATEELAKEE